MQRILESLFNYFFRSASIGLGATLIFISCEKKTANYHPQEWRSMLVKHYPTTEFISYLDPEKQIHCSDYGVGCDVASIIKVKNIEFIVLEFKTPEQAQNEAKRIGQWYSKNLVFDDVMGELILEDFIKEVFEAAPGVHYIRPYHTPLPRPEKAEHQSTGEDSHQEAPTGDGGGEHH